MEYDVLKISFVCMFVKNDEMIVVRMYNVMKIEMILLEGIISFSVNKNRV